MGPRSARNSGWLSEEHVDALYDFLVDLGHGERQR